MTSRREVLKGWRSGASVNNAYASATAMLPCRGRCRPGAAQYGRGPRWVSALSPKHHWCLLGSLRRIFRTVDVAPLVQIQPPTAAPSTSPSRSPPGRLLDSSVSPSQSPPRTPPRLPRLVHRGVPSCELQLQRRSASKCPVAATSSSRCLHGQSGTDFPQRPMSLSRPGRTTSRPFASRPTATDCPCKARSAGVARRTTKRSPSETTA